MKVKSESEVTQSCPTLHDPMDCSPPGSSIHGTLQAKVLEWGAILALKKKMGQGRTWNESDIKMVVSKLLIVSGIVS